MSIPTYAPPSKVWNRVSKANPCRVDGCGHVDWCTYTDDGAACCMRIQSDKPMRNGGWLHKINASTPRPAPPLRRTVAKPVNIDWNYRERQYTPPDGKVKALADKLGVSEYALNVLGVGWAWDRNAWSFPMKDETGRTVGMRLRNEDGAKWCVTGSSNALFIPDIEPREVLYIVEGASDAAAGVDLGWWVVGRPNCSACLEMILKYVARVKARQVVIVPDLDDNQAGQRGADALQAKLRVPSKQLIVPCKDLRQAVQSGYTSRMAANQLRDTLWVMPPQPPPVANERNCGGIGTAVRKQWGA